MSHWYLDYTTASTLLRLAERLPHWQAEVVTDSVGVYQYLRLRRVGWPD